jgi:hypothetical protein
LQPPRRRSAGCGGERHRQTGTAVGGVGGGAGGDGGNGDASVVQASAQSNANAQSASIGDLTAGNIEITNSTDIHAGGDGLVAASQANAAIDQTQDAAQANDTGQTGTAVGGAGGVGGAGLGVGDGGDGGDALMDQASAQSNANAQSASIGDLTAGNMEITNSADIHADGGDGLVAASQVNAAIDQTQDAAQANDTKQTGTAVGGAGGAGGGGLGAGNGGDGGNATVNQASAQSNANAQSALVGDLTAGDVVIDNSTDVYAAGDGLVATSQANASIDQTQDAAQANDAEQTGTAVGGAGGDGGDGLNGGNGGTGGDASVDQASAQSNGNAQSAAIGDLTAGDVVIDNSTDIMPPATASLQPPRRMRPSIRRRMRRRRTAPSKRALPSAAPAAPGVVASPATAASAAGAATPRWSRPRPKATPTTSRHRSAI